MAVTKIEYFSGPTKIGERLVEPFTTFEWTSNLPAIGTHSITAKVYVDGVLNYTTGPRVIEIFPWRGLLDRFPGATQAYSFRLLSKDYTGSCIQVLRTSDNTTLDVGFTADRYLDIQAINDFWIDGGSTGSVYMMKLYNQVQDNYHMTKLTANPYGPRVLFDTGGVKLFKDKYIDINEMDSMYGVKAPCVEPTQHMFQVVSDTTHTINTLMAYHKVYDANTVSNAYLGRYANSDTTTAVNNPTLISGETYIDGNQMVTLDGDILHDSLQPTESFHVVSHMNLTINEPDLSTYRMLMFEDYKYDDTTPSSEIAYAARQMETIIYPSSAVIDQVGIEDNMKNYYI